MSAETNKTFIRHYLEAIRKDKSPKTLDTYMTDEDLKHHIAMYEGVLPGYWIEAEQLIAEDDLVNVHGLIKGVHSRPFGNVPPSGKHVSFPIFITYRIVSGKIVEHWMLVDMPLFLQQIGATPAPA